MNRAELATEALLWEQVAEAATARAKSHRAELEAAAVAEYTEQGTAISWRIPDLAEIILPVSKRAIVVTDPHQLAQYVARVHPNQVETRVRPAFLELLLKRLRIDEYGVACDDLGEIVPGVQVHEGGTPQSIRIRPNPDAKAHARRQADALLERLRADATVDGT